MATHMYVDILKSDQLKEAVFDTNVDTPHLSVCAISMSVRQGTRYHGN